MLYEDLSSDQRVLIESLTAEDIPRLVAFNRALEPLKLTGECSYGIDRIEAVELEIYLQRPEDIQHLNRLFRSCGYHDMEQLKSQLQDPKVDISISFSARQDALEQYSHEILPLKSLQSFLSYETYFGQQIFLNLDFGYTFVSAQVKVNSPQ